MAWRRRDEASTSSIGLMIAAATMSIAFTTANFLVEEPGGMDPRTPQLEASATTALEVIVQQSGRTHSGGEWVLDADEILRFGLSLDGQPNFLDYRKIKAMRNATLDAAVNDAPDYADVRAALGIDGQNFHLRTYPVIPGFDDPRWTKEPRGRFAYFAHYSGATGVAEMESWVNATATHVNVSVAVRNDGVRDSIFLADVGLGDLDAGDVRIEEQRHTRLLAPGEVQTLWVEFPRLSSWDDLFDGVRISLADAYGNSIVDPTWTATAPIEGGSATWGVTLHANQLYYVTGDQVQFTGDHYDGEGEHLNTDQSGRFVLVGPNGDEWVNTTSGVTLPKGNNKVWTYTCQNCTAVGNYTARLWTSSMSSNASDSVHVSAAEMFEEKTTIDPLAVREIQIVKELVAGFNDVQYDTAEAPEGDIFGDDSNGPNEIADELPRYSTLIVGSEVSQTALNAAATKYAIADWVQAGGNLIVLGTDQQQSNWLEPIYHAAQITANGGIGTPDPTHPVLSSPNKLNYQSYLDRGRAWRIDSDQPFTHVLTRTLPNGGSMHDTLAIAAPGTYNDGTVVLTSYMPGSLLTPQDDEEAKRFLHNLMSQSYNMLFLDYGPPVPDGVPVGSSQRLVAVPHPNVPGAVVEVRIVMYVW